MSDVVWPSYSLPGGISVATTVSDVVLAAALVAVVISMAVTALSFNHQRADHEPAP